MIGTTRSGHGVVQDGQEADERTEGRTVTGRAAARIKKLLLALLIAMGSVVVTAGPASAETDYLAGYLFSTDGVTRGQISDTGVHWGWGCGVKIGNYHNAAYPSSVLDRRADNMSVTVWRKYAAWGFNSGWKRIGYDDTSTSGAGSVYSSENYCDTKGVWIAVCVNNYEPSSTATSNRCVVDYKQDNS